MSARLPPWYVDALRQEILRLREMLEPLEKGNGGLGGKTIGSLTTNLSSAIKKQLLTCSLFWTITTPRGCKGEHPSAEAKEDYGDSAFSSPCETVAKAARCMAI